MKTMFYTSTCLRSAKLHFFTCLFLTAVSFTKIQAQTTYLSSFTNHVGNYASDNASCLAVVNPPTFASAENIATGTLSDYAVLGTTGGIVNLNTLCSSPYVLRAKLNLGNLTSIDASGSNIYYAGFRIQVSSLAQLSLLDGTSGSNFTIKTYMDDNSVQTLSGLPLGISLLSPGIPGNVYFAATQPFNSVQIEVGAGALSLIAASEIRFYYAYASTSPTPVILPVTLTSFTGNVTDKAIQLNWKTTSEKDVTKYEVEKRNSQGVFTVIGEVPAKGSANGAIYNFTDNLVVSGENTYRLKITNRDNGVVYSKVLSFTSEVTYKWKIYPTLLSSGEEINVRFATNSNSKSQVQLTSLQGQTVRSLSATDNSIRISTRGLAAGVYILKLYSSGELKGQEKIVIQ